MSDEVEEFDGDDEGDSAGIASLRKAHKAQAAELKAAREELAGLRTVARKTALAELLRPAGAERIAKYIPSDLEVTEDAVNAWLQENAADFGIDVSVDDENDEHRQQVEKVSRASDRRSSNEPNAERNYTGSFDEHLAKIQSLDPAEARKQGLYKVVGGF